MNIRHIKLIIKREYLERLRSPGFAIGTVLGVLGIAALSFLPQLLKLLDQETTVKVAIVDTRNIILPYLPKEASLIPEPAIAISAQPTSSQQTGKIIFINALAETPETLSQQVKEDKIRAYIIVEGTTANDAQFKLHAKDRPSTTTTSRIVSLLSAAATQARLHDANISPQQAAALFTPPDFKVEPIVGGSLKDEKEVFQSQALVYVLLILLYGTMVMYGVQVAMGVVQEKSSRVMEVLITSVRPLELMLGKVIGIGLLGLTQYALWVSMGFVALVLSGGLGGVGTASNLDLVSVPPATLIFFLVFFVLGYLVYAAIYAALGSLVNRIEDVNSITTPVTLVLVATYLVSLLALGNPDAEYVKWLSFVPFLTPMVMFIRISLSNPAWWEPLLSIVFLLAAIFFFSWVAAKIYRVGVLLYGKRPSLREIGRLVRAA